MEIINLNRLLMILVINSAEDYTMSHTILYVLCVSAMRRSRSRSARERTRSTRRRSRKQYRRLTPPRRKSALWRRRTRCRRSRLTTPSPPQTPACLTRNQVGFAIHKRWETSARKLPAIFYLTSRSWFFLIFSINEIDSN